jgi:hypothetical protein
MILVQTIQVSIAFLCLLQRDRSTEKNTEESTNISVLATESIVGNPRPLSIRSAVARRSKPRGENSHVGITSGLPLLPRLIPIY